MTDDKRRGWQSAEERDLASEKARRDRELEHKVTDPIPVSRDRRSDALGISQVDELAAAIAEDDGDLGEYDEWEADTGVTEEIRDRVKQSPELHLLFRKLRKERERRANQITHAMGKKPPAEAMSKLERNIRWAWRALALIAIPAISAALLAIRNVYAAGGDNREAQIERRMALEDVAALKAITTKLSVDLRDIAELARINARRIDDLRERRHLFDVAPRRDPSPVRSHP